MKEYKPSIFNVVVSQKDDGKALVFNTMTSAFSLLNDDGQKLLSDAQFRLENQQGAGKESVEQLASLGFLVEQDFDELAFLELQGNLARYGNRNLILTIAPTLDCNMCCPYCYESKRKESMSAETADKILHFLTDYIQKEQITSVSVTWYGGEPLLEMDRIEQISKTLISFCEENHIGYSADIVTNGFLLSKPYAERLKGNKVKCAQITIDGLEETHNSRRKLKNGGRSFYQIIDNIELAKDILDIRIRVNVDEDNLHEIDVLANFFLDEKKWGKNPSFYLAPVEKATDSCHADPQKCLHSEEFSQLRGRIMRKLQERGMLQNGQALYPQYNSLGCGALAKNYFIIDSSGRFYSCWNHIGDFNKSVGNIDEPERIRLNREYLRWLTVPLPAKCKECVYLPLCQGGCPDKRLKNQNEPSCSFYPLTYIDNLKLAYYQYTTQKSTNPKAS